MSIKRRSESYEGAGCGVAQSLLKKLERKRDRPLRYITERKIRYDATLAKFKCEVLKLETDYAVLDYKMPKTVAVGSAEIDVKVSAGSRTFAHDWTKRPYNIYSGETAAENSWARISILSKTT
ncbi:hypothetical protein [Sporolactobacillus pectinivorans]|uniref:hypothetical protein n=1 Tax=Sporolactobacillus pectinivorans TaxID=1591408 RepID=UPI000C25A21A|nr:hypothetical protein [Sporolactobacillus pectinivorans]